MATVGPSLVASYSTKGVASFAAGAPLLLPEPCRWLGEAVPESIGFIGDGFAHVSQTLFHSSGSQDAPRIKRQDLSQSLGEGGIKEVFSFDGGQKAVGVPLHNHQRFTKAIFQELADLEVFASFGLPTIRAELAYVDDLPAVLYHDLYLGNTKKRNWVNHVSPETTVDSFNEIVAGLRHHDLSHKDFQLGIQGNGRLMIVDPKGIGKWRNSSQFSGIHWAIEDMSAIPSLGVSDQLQSFPILQDPALAAFRIRIQ